MKKYAIGITLLILFGINSQELSAKSKEEAISDFDNLPSLTVEERVGTVAKMSLAPAVMSLYLKRILKAVMYIEKRLRRLEEKEGISAPILKEVSSVREALKNITSSSTNSTSASTVSAQGLD